MLNIMNSTKSKSKYIWVVLLFAASSLFGNISFSYAGTLDAVTPNILSDTPETDGRIPTGDLVHALGMTAYGLAGIMYWIDFFSAGNVHTSDDQAYIAFESAFPLADGYMTACYFASALLLIRQHPLAVPVGIAAGSASIFLGCMDLLYDLQHDKFRNMTLEMAFETGIIITSFTFGILTMIRLWRARDRLGV